MVGVVLELFELTCGCCCAVTLVVLSLLENGVELEVVDFAGLIDGRELAFSVLEEGSVVDLVLLLFELEEDVGW